MKKHKAWSWIKPAHKLPSMVPPYKAPEGQKESSSDTLPGLREATFGLDKK